MKGNPYQRRMDWKPFARGIPLMVLLLCAELTARAAESFRVATFNVQNYLLVATNSRPMKSELARAKVRESIRALHPDVLVLEEIGGTNALFELQSALKAEGLDLPNWDLVTGSDTNIQLAVLSRLKITARHPQTNDHFLLAGRRWRVSRGFEEVEIQVNDRYSFTLVSAHLKSKLAIPEADEADLRLAEAKVLRQKIDHLLAARPALNLIVLGDFNDSPDSESIRTIIGRGAGELVDTRPVQRDAASSTGAKTGSQRVAWTEYYAKEDVYSRMDYIFLSKAMAREWNQDETFVLDSADWMEASDHRPLVATFVAEER